MDLISGPDDEFLQYGDQTSPESYRKALEDLETFVEEEGPFDGVMAFSQGAGLAASLLIHQLQKNPREARLRPIFRCAIFFSGGVPEDPSALLHPGAKRRLMCVEEDGELLGVATAHIWGANDHLYPTFGPVLSQLCNRGQRADFIHQGGHEIPGPKDHTGVLNSIRVIKRAIQRADEAQ